MSNFTLEQARVIAHDDGGLTVTASAGSGKTRVMVERFIRLVVEGKASVKEVLAVTFTRLAAGELKDRLKKALCDEIKKGTNVQRLKEQLEDLPVADICTIDSFCAAIVRKYFYVVGVSPSFTVLDSAEAEAMKDKAAEETFEKLYDENDQDLLLLLKVFSKKRSDKAVKARILSLYNFADSEKDGVGFFEKFVDNYTPEGVKRVENELIALYFKKFKALTRPFYLLRSRAFELLMPKSTEYCAGLISYLNVLEENLNPDGMELFLSADRTKPREVSKDEIKKALNEDIKAAKEKLVKAVNEAKAVFFDENKYEKAVSSLPIAKALVKVVSEFEKTYSAAKKEAGVLDYGDIERFCYRILCDEAAKNEIANGYKYIFVDEYQDVNDVQQAIFEKIDRDNTFIVGDAKQSIYGFRGSDSDIFIRRLRAHAEAGGKTVNLSKNFRSTKGVLCCVNNVFSEIMTEESSGTNYAAEPMAYGGLYDDEPGSAEIVRFIDESEKEEEEYGVYGVAKHLEKLKNNKPNGEERLVRYIVENVCGTEIFDTATKEKRALTFGDVAVLTRTNTGLADRITKELVRCGIPVVSDSKRSIGSYPEIDLIVSVLKTVSTAGRDDIALASALKSPVGNLTDEDLYAIRKADDEKTDSFYDACVKYSADDETKLKLAKFFDYLEEVRLYASFETAAATLRKIFTDTGFDLYLLSKPLGKLKLKRAERFIAECEKSSLTVEGFLSRSDELLENMTISVSEGEEAVKIMSVHASKGLEFPVVILTELDRAMFTVDKRDEIICDRKAGIGLKYYDFETKKSGSNLVRDYVGFLRSEATKRDEMRLLYVAMTRAEHKLFMVVKSQPVYERTGAESAYAGKMSAFLCQTDCKYTEISSEEIPEEMELKRETKIILDGHKEADKRLIGEFLTYKYPFEDDTTLCLKKTVTEINSQKSDTDEADDTETKTIEKIFFDEEIPVPSSGKVKTATEGNAYHKFMQYADFSSDSTEELKRLISEGVFTEEEAKIINGNKLKKIFAHPLVTSVKDYELYRELPFIVYVDAATAGEKGEGKVLVQGVIDLLAVNGDHAVIVDYKFSSKGDEKLLETYEKQVDLYAFAVENALKLTVEKKCLFNINKVRVVEVK